MARARRARGVGRPRHLDRPSVDRFIAIVPPDALGGGVPAATIGAGLAGLVRHRLASGRTGVVGFRAPEVPLQPLFAVERGEIALLDRETASRPLGRLAEALGLARR